MVVPMWHINSRFIGPPLVVFDAGGDVPEAEVQAGVRAGGDTAPTPDALLAEVGAVFVLVLVLALVKAAGPEGNLDGGVEHADGRAARNLHQPVAGGIDAHPVEDGAGVNVVAGLAQAHCEIGGAVAPDGGDVKAGRAAQHGEVDVDGPVCRRGASGGRFRRSCRRCWRGWPRPSRQNCRSRNRPVSQ